MSRRPVSAVVLGTILVVVCDDGSIWELDPDSKWLERRPIPGTAAAHADEIRRQEPRLE